MGYTPQTQHPIALAKVALRTHRAEFEARKRAEWERESADLRNNLTQLVRDAHHDGASINTIMRDYGTTDRRTITDMLKEDA